MAPITTHTQTSRRTSPCKLRANCSLHAPGAILRHTQTIPGTNTSMKRRTALFAVTLISLVLLSTWFGMRWAADQGFNAGRTNGARTLDRLQLIWPDFGQMAEHDRRVLAYLAMRCHLHQEPLIAQNVVGCLRRASTGPDSAVHPAALARLVPPQHALSAEVR